jgi:hypothetical protein
VLLTYLPLPTAELSIDDVFAEDVMISKPTALRGPKRSSSDAPPSPAPACNPVPSSRTGKKKTSGTSILSPADLAEGETVDSVLDFPAKPVAKGSKGGSQTSAQGAKAAIVPAIRAARVAALSEKSNSALLLDLFFKVPRNKFF